MHQPFFRYFGGRGENKVSVLDQDWFGIGKTTLFGTGHRVSSDKVILQSQPDDLVMDRSFDTSTSVGSYHHAGKASSALNMQY